MAGLCGNGESGEEAQELVKFRVGGVVRQLRRVTGICDTREAWKPPFTLLC